MKVATEAVRRALQQEALARKQKGFEVADWKLGKPLALKDMVILAWRLVPETEDARCHQACAPPTHVLCRQYALMAMASGSATALRVRGSAC